MLTFSERKVKDQLAALEKLQVRRPAARHGVMPVAAAKLPAVKRCTLIATAPPQVPRQRSNSVLNPCGRSSSSNFCN
jgi:hypothetical protein